MLSGTDSQIVTPTSDTIILSPLTVTDVNAVGSGPSGDTIITSNDYDFPDPPGTLTAYYNFLASTPKGSLKGQSVGASATASTFSNNPAIAPPFTPRLGPGSLAWGAANEGVNFGIYAPGPGVLIGTITLTNFSPGDSIKFPATFEAVVPEPGSLVLLVTLLLAMALVMRKRTAEEFRQATRTQR